MSPSKFLLLLAILSSQADTLCAFSIKPSVVKSLVKRSVVPSFGVVELRTVYSSRSTSLLRMSEDVDAEAAKLREQAKKLREEVAALSDTKVEEEKSVEPAKAEPAKAQSGSFYDDEVELVYKDPLSDNMRNRLMNEASTGLDSQKPQTNTILYISVAIVALIALGGKGILY